MRSWFGSKTLNWRRKMVVWGRYCSLNSGPVNVARGSGAHGFGLGCLDFAAFALNIDHAGFTGGDVEK
jgi:hypothetical protein